MRSNFFAFNRWLSNARWGISFYLLIGLSHQLYAQVCPENHYQWPEGNGTQQIRLNGLFMEYRERQNPHFHDGIDVAIATNNPTVCVSNNSIVLQVNLVNPNNNDWEVRLRELDAPFREFYYYHLNATADSLKIDDILNAGDWVGNVNGFNHLHFCEGPNMAEVNPLTESDYGESLCPFIDTSDPVIWNYRIEYDNTNLPMPKIDNRYQVTGLVDILANCEDRISGPGSAANLGLYAIEYEVKDLSGNVVDENFNLFDSWLATSNINYVYSTALSNIHNPDTDPDSTVYWYEPTNHKTFNGYWDATNLSDGKYLLCINAYDVKFNMYQMCDTVEVANFPYVPTILGSEAGDQQTTLTFTGKGATSYRIYYDTDTGPPYQGTGADQGASPIEISVDSTVTKAVTLTGLTNGQTYYFAVKGYNSNTDEESSYSVEVSATPNIFPPPTPENFAASLNSAGFVQLTWEENDSSTAEAAGFIIFRSQTSGSGFSAIDSVATESFTDNTVSPNVTYYYKVQAYNSAGNSSQTAQVSQLAGLSGTLTGNITWSAPGAILAGEVELPSGSSISVQAGANITAATGAGVVLKIYGVFNVNGTEGSPVTFDRSGSSGNWIGIRYKANSEGTISWTTIRYAQKGVWVDNEDSIVLEHCTIENFASQGVYLNGSGTTVQNCTIRDAAGGAHGVYITGTCNPSILNTSISNAPIGIMRDTGSQAYATIDGNDISNCSNAGIQVLSANATIRNNSIHGCGYGIRLQTGSNASIHDNDIHANTTGVYLEQSQPSNLKWNNFGYSGSVSANSSASVLINWLNAGNSFMASKWNNFYNNGGLDISNQDSDTLAATGQYWNSQNLSGLVNTASAQTSHNANAGPGGDTGKPVVSEEESDQPLPASFTLQQNYPNPFNPSTRIRFALPARAVISLTIYDMNGRVVRHLIRQQSYEPGWPEATWDARNDAGAVVGSGIYFYRLTGRNLESNESFVQTHRLLLLR